MAFRIAWTEHSKLQREDLLRYGKRVWGVNNTRLFWAILRTKINSLAQSPLIGSVEPVFKHIQPEVRSFVLHPNYKIVYQLYIDTNTMLILGLWDTRRDLVNNI